MVHVKKNLKKLLKKRNVIITIKYKLIFFFKKN